MSDATFITEIVTRFTTANRGGITTTLEFRVGNSVRSLMSDWGIDMTNSGLVTIAFLINLALIPRNNFLKHEPNPQVVTWVIRERQPAAGQVPALAEIALTSVQADHAAFATESAWFRKLIDAVEKCKFWMIELVTCYQIRPLSAPNVVNYFKSQANTPVNARALLPLIAAAASAIPRVVDDPALRNLVSQSSFMVYHTTASSTPSLIQRVIDNLGPVADRVFSANTITVVQAASRAPWDASLTAAIPARAIAMTHAYLSANSLLPDNWFQGTKAVALVSAPLYRKWVIVFKKIMALSINEDGINASTDIDGVIAQAGNVFDV